MLTELREIVGLVSKAESTEAALSLLVQKTREFTLTDCCSIYQSDKDSQKHILRASDGLASGAVDQSSLDFGEGLVGLVADLGEPLNIANASQHARYKYLPETAEEGFNSFLGTPITHQGQVLGVLVLQQKQARIFHDYEESLLVTLAAQLAQLFLLNRPVKETLTNLQLQQRSINAHSGSAGIALGRAWLAEPQILLDSVAIEKTDQCSVQLELFEEALAQTLKQIENLGLRFQEHLRDQELHSVFDFYKHLLDDASLSGEIRKKIAEGFTAASAIKLICEKYVEQFESMDSSYFQERSTDIVDVSQRLVGNLLSQDQQQQYPDQAVILVADELTTSMLGDIKREHLVGIVSCRGASHSHAAILARAMGIPMVMGLDVHAKTLMNCELIINGERKELVISPSKDVQADYQEQLSHQQQMTSVFASELSAPAQTIDQQRLRLSINAGLSSQLELSTAEHDGIGLYRTEMAFMQQTSFPSEQEQFRLYSQVLADYAPKPVCIRVLDVGGDKPLSYFPIAEDNPFLGWRGIRLTLDHPEIFLVQARALYRASLKHSNLSILLPMVSHLKEIVDALSLLDKAWEEVTQETDIVAVRPKHGVMLEVPSTLYMLPELAQLVDFWSVGSNDLVQYLLAVDRSNVRVAKLYDPYQPAVIRALDLIVQEAQHHQIPLSICGEMAAEPLGLLLLLILGYRHFSINSVALARIKYLVRRLSLAELSNLRAEILAEPYAQTIQQRLENFLKEHQLDCMLAEYNAADDSSHD